MNAIVQQLIVLAGLYSSAIIIKYGCVAPVESGLITGIILAYFPTKRYMKRRVDFKARPKIATIHKRRKIILSLCIVAVLIDLLILTFTNNNAFTQSAVPQSVVLRGMCWYLLGFAPAYAMIAWRFAPREVEAQNALLRSIAPWEVP